jgi:hypothetical protein
MNKKYTNSKENFNIKLHETTKHRVPTVKTEEPTAFTTGWNRLNMA